MTDPGATPPTATPVSRQWAREQRSIARSAGAATPKKHDRSKARRRDGIRRLGSGAVVAFSLATLIFVSGLVALAWDGYRTSLEIKGGTSLEAVKDPTKAGYEAQVRPMKTHLLLQTDAEGAVTDGVLISPGSGGRGGSVVFIPGSTVVQTTDGNANLNKFIATNGVEAGIAEIEKILTFAVTDGTTVTPAQWTDLLGPLGPLTIENPDALVAVTGANQKQIVYAAGPLPLKPDQVGDYLTFVSDGEAEINRLPRTQLVWETWLKAIAADPSGAPTVTALAPVVGDEPLEISGLVLGLSKGPVAFQTLPTKAVSLPNTVGVKIYLPDPVGIAQMVPKVVPFPTSAFPGQRARTRILNGTTDVGAATRAADPVVGAGGEITVLGNASTFAVTKTTVEYHDPSKKEAADKVAAALAVTAMQSPSLTEAYDVTVTIGSEFTG